LEKEELRLLRELQDLANSVGAVFLPSIAVRATRYLTNTRGNVHAALRLMQATNAWNLQQFQVPSSEKLLADELKLGIVYWCGRDADLNPLLVFRACRIPRGWHESGDYDKVIKLVSFCLEYFLRYMSVPGIVETFSILVDMSDLTLTQIPVGTLRDMHKELSNHYTIRVMRIYVTNLSQFLRGIFAIAKTVLTDRQNMKVQVINNMSELLNDFAAHQLERDFGGTMENVQESFPFKLNPGPFTARYRGGPGKDAVPRVHNAFDPEGLRGRLWDPALGYELNTRQVYAAEAPDILRKCGIPFVETPEGFIRITRKGDLQVNLFSPNDFLECVNPEAGEICASPENCQLKDRDFFSVDEENSAPCLWCPCKCKHSDVSL